MRFAATRIAGFLRSTSLSVFVAVTFLLACCLIPMSARGQAQPAEAPPAPSSDVAQVPETAPPPPANFKNPIPADQLSFLKDYDGKSSKDILKDKRFKNLEKQITPSTNYFYHYDIRLSEARDQVLDNGPLPITVRDGRYVMVSSAGAPDAHAYGRGFIWFDMQTGIGLGGIYFHPTNGEPTPTLAIYSKQLTDTYLSMGQLPAEFYADFGEWARITRVKYISPRYFIPDDNRKYALFHDEDYCAHPDGEPKPEGCDEMNYSAADVDLDAVYFMQQTHNATDATAFMLGPDQMEWLAMRDRTCMGPDATICRIRVTRRRVVTLTGHPVPLPHLPPVQK